MSFRQPLLRAFQTSRGGYRASPFLRSSAFRTHGRRTAATAAEANVEQAGFKKFWNSPVGPKTVHFWAPVMKWCLVLAGVADFARPAESLSLSQNAALTATGAIWTRWCFIIRPKNVFLATVNFFLFCVGTTQVSRVLLYRRSLKNSTVTEEAESAAKEAKDSVEGAVETAKQKV